MNIIRYYLYACSYDDRFFTDVAAVDVVQARALFEQWLYENYKVSAALGKTVISREVRTRNLIGYS